MADIESGRGNVLPLPRWTLIIHAVQILLAIIVLGLSAYGVRWIAYNVLIYALVVCICTLGVCAYIIGASLALHHFYNAWVVLGLHIWMIIFWIVDLGLVADLARIWSTYDDYLYGYGYYYGYDYSDYYKRDTHHLAKRETTTYKAYYGALAAGAFFAAVQFALWTVGTIIVAIYLNKRRTAAGSAPPAYVNNGQAVQMETKPEQYQQQTYSVAPTPQTQYAQPTYPQQPQPTFNQYPQDPVNREATVSPVSQAGYPPASELASPQHTGGYNPMASELPSKK